MEALSLQPLQRYFEAFYRIEPSTSVDEFVCFADSESRETVLVRTCGDALELGICLPFAVKALEPDQDRLPPEAPEAADLWAQVIEAVSHFVLLAERARVELPTTHLELELQAEVDKFLLLARPFDATRECVGVHQHLFGPERYLDPLDTERGARYRYANQMAARYTRALCRSARVNTARRELGRFFRAGQTGKLSMVLAA